MRTALLGSFLAALTLGALAQTASAASPPHYSLSVVEGATTQSEYENVGTSGDVESSKEISIAIIRGGVEIVRDSAKGGASTSQIPQVGDVVTLESPRGTMIASQVYDGLPSMDPTVCAGSVNFSGQRTAGEEVEGGFFSFKLHVDPYSSYLEKTGTGIAQVTTLSGSAYNGNFLTPLAIGQTVHAREVVKTPLPNGAVFTYSSENERPVGACPLPPAPPPPPPPLALQGTILKLTRTTIHKLLKLGLSDVVGINQPGTVTQALYLRGGTLPANAASAKRGRHKLPPALLLARGAATAANAGEVTVHLKLTKRGRGKLKTAKRVKATLITTLRAGRQTLSLPRRTVSLHR
ncbi:MAG TPA: hypothetical protein VFY36_12025 [Solirubrobacteraceae bacterium]|nr:hypothetical protein [Solirubrobacteraceae bacterium]